MTSEMCFIQNQFKTNDLQTTGENDGVHSLFGKKVKKNIGNSSLISTSEQDNLSYPLPNFVYLPVSGIHENDI